MSAPGTRREARWRPPRPYGYPAAIDAMGTIAAPLLASVSVALVAVVLTSASAFRFISGVLLLLVLAAAAFVATIEFSFMARRYVVTPTELEEWWPDHAEPGRRRSLRREQRYCRSQFRVWTDRARTAYNVGILALSLGVVVLLIPPGHVGLWRLLVIIVAAFGAIAEAMWIVTRLTRHEEPELPEVSPEPSSPSASGSS